VVGWRPEHVRELEAVALDAVLTRAVARNVGKAVSLLCVNCEQSVRPWPCANPIIYALQQGRVHTHTYMQTHSHSCMHAYT
jgi:hypothetical protein